MPHPQSGDTIVVHYTGRLDDGGGLIPLVEETLIGMQPGDERTITIPPDGAYGPHRPELVFTVDRSDLPPGLEPELGQQLRVQQDSGETAVVTVAAVSPAQVVIGANHPLAGENLTFDLELVEIRAPT